MVFVCGAVRGSCVLWLIVCHVTANDVACNGTTVRYKESMSREYIEYTYRQVIGLLVC